MTPDQAGSLGPLPDRSLPATEGLGIRACPEVAGYEVLRVLGEGGMGVVYLALQKGPLQRQVALKIVKPGLDSQSVITRFETERQALALMDHPNIAKVFDGGATDDGRPYFVMELVKGISITEYCDKNQLNTRRRLDLFVQVCQAVQHAHQKGIIHRDIKPSNVLITLLDDVPVPKVIDFGVAKATNQRLAEKTLFTQFGQMVGTPEYMSPEQAEMTDLDIDTRTDIYSLGVLLYELLTGCTPFEASTLRQAGYAEMQRIICQTDPPRPSTKLSSLRVTLPEVARRRQANPEMLSRLIRGDLDWIVMKCLEKDRTRRYETAHALAEDIGRHLRDEPISAGRPGTVYRCRKFLRRHKAPFTATAVIAVALILAAAISADQAVRATRARNEARQAEESERRERQEAQAQRDEAQAARKIAEEERQKAAASELAVRRSAYSSDMILAQHANPGRTQELLNRHRPKPGEQDLRGWEWRYLWQQCRSDVQYTLCQRPSRVYSLATSPDGRWLAVGDFNKDGVLICDLTTRREVAQLPGGEDRPWLASSAKGSLLAIAGLESLASRIPKWSICLWDWTTLDLKSRIPLLGDLLGLTFSEDGHSLATMVTDPNGQDEIAIWSIPDGTKRVSWRATNCAPGYTFGPHFAASRDLRLGVYTFDRDRQICLIDLATGEKRWTAQNPNSDHMMAYAFHPTAPSWPPRPDSLRIPWNSGISPRASRSGVSRDTAVPWSTSPFGPMARPWPPQVEIRPFVCGT
jgi:serine/threonine protein kinase